MYKKNVKIQFSFVRDRGTLARYNDERDRRLFRTDHMGDNIPIKNKRTGRTLFMTYMQQQGMVAAAMKQPASPKLTIYTMSVGR